MIGNKCALDTSVIIHFFKNNGSVTRLLKNFEEIYVSAIVVGELYYGAYSSSNPPKHIEQIQSFLSDCILFELTIKASIVFAELKAELKRNALQYQKLISG